MTHHHYVLLALIGGIAVGYLAVSTLNSYPVYNSAYNFGAGLTGANS